MEKMLRGRRKFSVLETRNDGVKFTCPPLLSLSQHHQSLRERYDSAQRAIVEEVLGIAAGYSQPLSTLSSLLATLDVLLRFSLSLSLLSLSLSLSLSPVSCLYLFLCSFAHISTMAPMPYVRPTLLPMGMYILSGCCQIPSLVPLSRRGSDRAERLSPSMSRATRWHLIHLKRRLSLSRSASL